MKKTKKMSKRVKSCENGEIVLLPEGLIHRIHSFLTEKDAAATTILCKSWYAAWLTRPTLDFDQSHFRNGNGIEFTKFVRRSMGRYQDSKLQIDCFRLRTTKYNKAVELGANELSVKAMELGATDLNLQLRSLAMLLPREVLESETLLRLSVSGRSLTDGNYVKCSSLKTLNLGRVHIESDDVFREMISRCVSIEELSLSHCRGGSSSSGSRSDQMFGLSSRSLPGHLKLRSLFMEYVYVYPSFFKDNFGSRFPCLKDLSVVLCFGYNCEMIRIHSTSLETISFEQKLLALNAEFEVPNLVYLRFSGGGIPSFSVQSSREWEYHLSLPRVGDIPGNSWYPRLKNSLTKMMTPSKIFLNIKSSFGRKSNDDVQPVAKGKGIQPLELENVMLESYSTNVILVGLLKYCRPHFITLYWLPEFYCKTGLMNASLDWVCKRLMKKFITPNRCIPDQKLFGKIGLKEVNVRLYEEILTEWRPLDILLKEPLDLSIAPKNKRRISFQLIWK